MGCAERDTNDPTGGSCDLMQWKSSLMTMSTLTGTTATELVVAYVRGLIDRGELKRGDRLPAERDLAEQSGSEPAEPARRPAIACGDGRRRTIRPGAGSFIAAGPPALGPRRCSFRRRCTGSRAHQMFEARLVLEVAVAGMAAEHATSDDLDRDQRRSHRHVRVDGRPADLPPPRHRVSPGGGAGVGQPDPVGAGRAWSRSCFANSGGRPSDRRRT